MCLRGKAHCLNVEAEQCQPEGQEENSTGGKLVFFSVLFAWGGGVCNHLLGAPRKALCAALLGDLAQMLWDNVLHSSLWEFALQTQS